MLRMPEAKPLAERVSELLEYIQCNDTYIERNEEALEIYEGDLAEKVDYILKSTLSPEYYGTIRDRLIPINFMPKMIDKMAQVYSTAPKRTCEKEQAFIDDYQRYLDIDSEMSLADEYANLFKGYALEPFISDGKPSLRSLPFDSFLVKGDDPSDKRKVTVFIKFMGTRWKDNICNKTGKVDGKTQCQWYIAYTDDEILAFDSDEDIMPEVTEDINGVNPIGVIPFVYGNRSKQRLLPTQDSDLIQMIKMFPVLFTDLGGAIMYQCFTIMYGIDVDSDQIKMSPNAFWDFKSDKNSDKKPEIGTVKPEAAVEKVLSFISHLMGAWAESKSIKIGSIGKVEGESMASGVSKIVDEMDTFEVRKKNIPFFRKEEKELWYKMALHNNHWLASDEIDLELYPTSKVDATEVKKTFNAEFEPPKPMENRNEVVDTQLKELNNKLTTRKRAVEKINSELEANEIDELLSEIDVEDEDETLPGDGDDQDNKNNEVGNDKEEKEL